MTILYSCAPSGDSSASEASSIPHRTWSAWIPDRVLLVWACLLALCARQSFWMSESGEAQKDALVSWGICSMGSDCLHQRTITCVASYTGVHDPRKPLPTDRSMFGRALLEGVPVTDPFLQPALGRRLPGSLAGLFGLEKTHFSSRPFGSVGQLCSPMPQGSFWRTGRRFCGRDGEGAGHRGRRFVVRK